MKSKLICLMVALLFILPSVMAITPAKEEWISIEAGGKTMGYIHYTIAQDKEMYRVDRFFTMNYSGSKVVEHIAYDVDENGIPIDLKSETDVNGKRSVVTCNFEKGKVITHIEKGGTTTSIETPVEADTHLFIGNGFDSCDILFQSLKLKENDRKEVNFFSYNTLQTFTDKLTVEDRVEIEGGEMCYEISSVALATTFYVSCDTNELRRMEGGGALFIPTDKAVEKEF